MNKEWLKELRASRRAMWLCRLSQQTKRKAKEAGLEIKVEVATTIRLVKISKKEIGRIRESPLTKETKEVVLQVEEEVVVESLTRVTFIISIVTSIVTIRQL